MGLFKLNLEVLVSNPMLRLLREDFTAHCGLCGCVWRIPNLLTNNFSVEKSIQSK